MYGRFGDLAFRPEHDVRPLVFRQTVPISFCSTSSNGV